LPTQNRHITMFCLENDHIKIWIKPKGAELKSITNKKTSQEYMWEADPKFWGKCSPVLFPIVGGLKNNEYTYQGKSYEMGRHGFARDRVFTLESKSDDSLTFLLKSDAESLAIYPFQFEFRIKYSIVDKTLKVAYNVKNTGRGPMYFSLGAHPAFKVPLDEELAYSDYFLHFEKAENGERWLLNNEGLINGNKEVIDTKMEVLPLSKELFKYDALVFKGLMSTSIGLKSSNSSRGLNFRFEGFPYFGIWAAENANFVCLEPWCGIADSTNHNQNLTDKDGIEKLEGDANFDRSWSVEVY
jgi:galactose mutarotase-like enzyme